MNDPNFQAQEVVKKAVIKLNAPIGQVFPLFSAFEERKWATGWHPALIYTASETIEEGTTFKTPAHTHAETEYLWRVNRYEPQQYLIHYLVTTPNRYWTIRIECDSVRANQTRASITYQYLSLNRLGNALNEQAARQMYHHL